MVKSFGFFFYYFWFFGFGQGPTGMYWHLYDLTLFLFDTSTLNFIYAPEVNAAALPKASLLQVKVPIVGLL